jgi:hypothetical protein
MDLSDGKPGFDTKSVHQVVLVDPKTNHRRWFVKQSSESPTKDSTNLQQVDIDIDDDDSTRDATSPSLLGKGIASSFQSDDALAF